MKSATYSSDGARREMQRYSEPLSVLLVEDNEVDVEITERVLARSGCAITMRVARDGKEALDLLVARAPELPALILLDLGLPGIGGMEVLRLIKRDQRLAPIPVAVLTGASGERTMLESMAMGGNMYFAKPMTGREASALVPAVERYWRVMNALRLTVHEAAS